MTVTTSQVRSMVEDQSNTFEPVDQDSDYEFDDDPEYGRSSFLLIIGFIIVGIFFVGVIWFAYQQGIRTGMTRNLPLITAEAGPVKVTPSQEGADETPFQDSLILNDDASMGIESVLDETEEPVDPPANDLRTSTDSSVAVNDVPSETANDLAVDETLDTIAVPSPNPERIAGQDPASEVELEVPVPAETEELATVESEVAAVEEAATEELEVPVPEVLETPEETVAMSPVAAAEVPEPTVLEPEESETAEVAAVDTSAGATTADVTSGNFVVQILSSPDQTQAGSERDKFAARFKDMLTERSIGVQRADLGSKGVYWRIQIGPFADRGGAGQYCNQLKARGQDCFVTKP